MATRTARMWAGVAVPAWALRPATAIAAPVVQAFAKHTAEATVAPATYAPSAVAPPG